MEKRRQINQLRKERFDARDRLIVIENNKTPSKAVSCIKMTYNIECGIINPWHYGMNPEDAYRAVELGVSYCPNFDPGNLMLCVCCDTTCPMYQDYINYKNKCLALQEIEAKTR